MILESVRGLANAHEAFSCSFEAVAQRLILPFVAAVFCASAAHAADVVLISPSEFDGIQPIVLDAAWFGGAADTAMRVAVVNAPNDVSYLVLAAGEREVTWNPPTPGTYRLTLEKWNGESWESTGYTRELTVGGITTATADDIELNLLESGEAVADDTFVDIALGTRTNTVVRPITYSSEWTAGADGVKICLNDEPIFEGMGEGTLDWTPTESGTYILTHEVMMGGEQVGETLSATFLAKIAKPDGGPYTETVDDIEWTYMVSGGNASIGGDKSSKTAIPSSATGIITIPSILGGCSVTSLSSYAFSGCSGVTSVIIPEGVTSIGDSSFRDCKGLSSLIIPEGVTNIGNCAFINCSGLKSVTIPPSMTRIGDCAFSDCKGLTSIAIPSSVTSIGNYAFFGCSGLTRLSTFEHRTDFFYCEK